MALHISKGGGGDISRQLCTVWSNLAGREDEFVSLLYIYIYLSNNYTLCICCMHLVLVDACIVLIYILLIDYAV